MHPMLNIAVRAARSAGDLIMRRFERLDTIAVETKQRNDYVSEVDREAEGRIIDTLLRTYPSHGILAEESGERKGDGHVWVIDPLDGTTNFLHGFPHFAVSIALMADDRLEQGVIYDPVRQELFTASRGSGAEVNNRRMRVSQRRGLEGALLGTGFPYRDDQPDEAYMDMLREFMRLSAGVRRPGSAALDLAYLAAGRIDGFWELGLSRWDIAAGALLVREAGGIVGDLHGGDDYLASGDVIAANPKVYHAMMTQVIQPQSEKIRGRA
ncbi:MAG: inositol monophosphatase family protein [Halofilum sp. (in: g-proteobacteria)]|nr:inositol monophosphatase family protein [Halofilum sp. (in: g-proteobacteria)]